MYTIKILKACNAEFPLNLLQQASGDRSHPFLRREVLEMEIFEVVVAVVEAVATVAAVVAAMVGATKIPRPEFGWRF
jgi:hypothetical protein